MKYRTIDQIKNVIECLIGFGTLEHIIKLGETAGPFISDNVPDMIYPFIGYTGVRAISCDRPSLPIAAGLAVLGTSAEIAQYFGIFGSNWNPRDIPMYFIGAAIAFGIDKLTYNKKKANLEN